MRTIKVGIVAVILLLVTVIVVLLGEPAPSERNREAYDKCRERARNINDPIHSAEGLERCQSLR